LGEIQSFPSENLSCANVSLEVLGVGCRATGSMTLRGWLVRVRPQIGDGKLVQIALCGLQCFKHHGG
jgi:hypothetical protein